MLLAAKTASAGTQAYPKKNAWRDPIRSVLPIILSFFIVLLALCFVGMHASADGALVPINETTFPDANFRNIVLANYSDGIGHVNGNIKDINVSNQGIADMTGIEHYTNLTGLSCANNSISSLDVSHNTALTFLACSGCNLAALDVSQNTALEVLWCNGNQIAVLDVSKNTALWSLDCGTNRLTQLNVGNNARLTGLGCSYNPLTTLDVAKNIALTDLRCDNCQIAALDVAANASLVRLLCNNNRLTSLDLTHNAQLSTTDVSGQSNESLYFTQSGGKFYVDLASFPNGDQIDLSRVTMTDGGLLDTTTGIVTYTALPAAVTYTYDTLNPQSADILMTVTSIAPMPTFLAKPIKVGETICNFSARLLDGSIFSIRDYRGKVVIVNVYSVWCTYCQKEVPDLQKLSDKYPDTLVVLGLNKGQTADLVSNFVNTYQLTYLQALDVDRSLSNGVFPSGGIPYTVVIDRNGKVTKAQSGVYTGTSMYTYLRQWYLQALAKTYVPAPDPGDANDDGAVDIMDLVVIVDYIVNGNEPASMDGADANGDGSVDIMDLVFIINLIVNPPVSSGVRVDAALGNTVSVEVPFSSSTPITALELEYTLSPGLTFVNAECSSMIGAGGDTNALFANVNSGVTAGSVTLTMQMQNGITAHQSVNVTAITGANTSGTLSVGTLQIYVIDVNTSGFAILTQPIDTTVSLGNTATFTVEATGPEPLTYQWYVNTNTGVGWMAIAGATESAYTTGAAVIGDDGFRYFCRVTAGESYLDSAVATLTVVAAPRTGDGSHPYFLLALALPAASGLSAISFRRRKQANDKKLRAKTQG